MSRRHFKKPTTSIFGVIGKVAPWVAFVSQITSKDAQAIQSQTGFMNQIGGYMNAITGRLTGINLFKNNPVQAKQTINISGINNTWTQMGIGALIYGELAKHFHILPQGAKVRSIGKKVFIGGAVGGLFDDPTNQTIGIQQAFPNQYLGQVPVSQANTSGQGITSGLRPF